MNYSFHIQFKGINFQVTVQGDNVLYMYNGVIEDSIFTSLKYYLKQEGFLDSNLTYKTF